MLVPAVLAARSSLAPLSRLVILTVSEVRFALSMSRQHRVGVGHRHRPAVLGEAGGEVGARGPGAVIGVEVQHRRVVDRGHVDREGVGRRVVGAGRIADAEREAGKPCAVGVGRRRVDQVARW